MPETSGAALLESQPWYPVRPGDLVHIAYEAAGELAPYGETYIVEAQHSDSGREVGLRLRLLTHTAPGDAWAGHFAPGPLDSPLMEAWMEAGPQRMTIVRDGQVIHPARPAAPAVPTQEGINAAVRALMRAWSPGTLLPGDPGYGQADEGDDEPGCGCGGIDDATGEPLCNCGDGCSCELCEASRHKQTKYCCWRAEPSMPWCGKAARYRVVRSVLVEQLLPDDRPDAVCAHPQGSRCSCRPGSVWVDAGPSVQVVQAMSACSIAHAVALRDAWQTPGAYSGREFYRIEQWDYTPHYSLPEPLALLRENLAQAVRWAAEPWSTPEVDDGTHESAAPVREEPAELEDTPADEGA